jgi:hypothetical protein
MPNDVTAVLAQLEEEEGHNGEEAILEECTAGRDGGGPGYCLTSFCWGLRGLFPRFPELNRIALIRQKTNAIFIVQIHPRT